MSYCQKVSGAKDRHEKSTSFSWELGFFVCTPPSSHCGGPQKISKWRFHRARHFLTGNANEGVKCLKNATNSMQKEKGEGK